MLVDLLKPVHRIKSDAAIGRAADPARSAAFAISPRSLRGAEDDFHRVDFRNSRLIPTSRVPIGSLHSRARLLKCFGAPQEPLT
eukprot:s4444_g12.t1